MAIPHIYFKDYGKAQIFCPSYSEQLKYAKFLATIDDKLLTEQNVLINLSLQKLEEQKRISIVFRRLHELLAIHNNLLTEYSKQKQYLLSQMFI